jgi:transcriptional regulator with XRE-family HTH domain
MHHATDTVWAVLLRARWRAGLTQEELAAKTGLSVRTVSDIERGRVGCPRAATLRSLALALGMTGAETGDLLLQARVTLATERCAAGDKADGRLPGA